LLSGYLFAFLNTNYGKDQVARYARPTGQYNLNLQEVGHILIPLIPLPEQEAIETLILNSSELLENSYDCYTAAQQLLESELDLDRLTFKKPVGYTARFKELRNQGGPIPNIFILHFKTS
jgi:type I restriction enzyme S subunit